MTWPCALPLGARKPNVFKAMAETERFELSVPYSQHDGLANPDLPISKRLNSRNFSCFHHSNPRAERATDALARNLCRHKSRHTSHGGQNDLQNRRLRAERARSAKRATSESAVTERPLGGLQPATTVHDIAGQLHSQNTFPWNLGQALNGREGSHEHHPCA